ncbi:cation diffusion facilitator family transporter [Gallibacterium anatis]|uniref:Cation-efflux pump FieF n=1 Tax=Gallibacterium anatis TaxID=750 RepID=A0AAX3X973_9PAST|nr:cation diffusion facilitator family transporter [Gallibacterium anatis]KGQ57148.1 ferrous iron transporter [Gallibacterium anatis str. Avicor]KGQ61340.1 ferrous iron transporter [Gallibacterium anatis 7990]MDK9429186.1 cation diffusion facilitator family transporter [Gallibacterium anatis]WAX70380.1 cation diffusion facilitator family transporter [Gallibacterium anatis]WIM78564.1 cation diffusion facilitator family transporter [Gallibacterium anatis]
MKDRYSIYVKRAACLAIFTAFFLVSIKAIAWWKTGSVSILAAITDSLLDLLASFTNMLILRFALMPADDNHSFGHGKAESLASLAQGMFICGSVVFLFLQGIQRLHSPEITDHNIWGIAVTIVSVIMTAILVSFQKYTIKRTDSPAIKADSLHYQTDLFMNLGILIALVISYYGFVMADAICALIIAVYILINALKMVAESVQMLLDVALPEEEIAEIKKIAQRHPKVLGVHDIKTRRAGAVRFIQLHLELEDHLPLIVAHDITEELEQELQQAFPNSDIMIHQEPTTVVKQEMAQTTT